MEIPKPANPESIEPARSPWRSWLTVLLVVVVLAYAVYRKGVPIYVEASLPKDAPRIAFSPNDTWIEEFGANEAYRIAFLKAKGRLIEIQPEDTGADPHKIEEWLQGNRIQGLVLAGGGDVDPQLYGQPTMESSQVNRLRDDFEIALIKVAIERDLPILGICRGCQILNVARGGSLQNLSNNEEAADLHFNINGHPVDLAEGSRISGIVRTNRIARVNSFHRQAVDRLGQNLRITATGPHNIVEAIESTNPNDPWMVAVQWHPEMYVDNVKQEALLLTFVQEAKR